MSQKLANKQAKQVPLDELVEAIRSREDLVKFVRALCLSLKERPGEWENADLESYLEAIGAWVEDMNGYFKGRGEAVPEQPTWKTLGQILLSASVYE
jgi:hypothetical protein